MFRFFVFFDYLYFFVFFSKLLLKVTEDTTEHQKWPKISQNSKKKALVLHEGQKSLRQRLKPSAGAIKNEEKKHCFLTAISYGSDFLDLCQF